MVEVIKHGNLMKKYVHTCSKCGCIVTYQKEDIDKVPVIKITEKVPYEKKEGNTISRGINTIVHNAYPSVCPECGQQDNIIEHIEYEEVETK